jgi:hypothetical protein
MSETLESTSTTVHQWQLPEQLLDQITVRGVQRRHLVVAAGLPGQPLRWHRPAIRPTISNVEAAVSCSSAGRSANRGPAWSPARRVWRLGGPGGHGRRPQPHEADQRRGQPLQRQVAQRQDGAHLFEPTTAAGSAGVSRRHPCPERDRLRYAAQRRRS